MNPLCHDTWPVTAAGTESSGVFASPPQSHHLRLMEHVGKWSMMDIMRLAFLVTRRRSLSSCDGLERFNHCGLQFGLTERRNDGLVLLPQLTGKSNAFNG